MATNGSMLSAPYLDLIERAVNGINYHLVVRGLSGIEYREGVVPSIVDLRKTAASLVEACLRGVGSSGGSFHWCSLGPMMALAWRREHLVYVVLAFAPESTEAFLEDKTG